MENKSKITPEESLKIISDTLVKSSKALETSVLRHMLLWGVLVVVTAMLVGHLWEHNGGPKWNYLWFVMIVAGVVSERVLFKNESKLPDSHLTSIFKFNGIILGAFCIIFTIAGTLSISLIDYSHAMLISFSSTSFFIIVFGFSSCITGYLMQNRFVIAMGVLSGTLAPILAMLVDGSYKMLVIAAVAFITMVLPYFLKKK